MKFSFYLLKVIIPHGDRDGSGGVQKRAETAGQGGPSGKVYMNFFSYFMETFQSQDSTGNLKHPLPLNVCFPAAYFLP